MTDKERRERQRRREAMRRRQMQRGRDERSPQAKPFFMFRVYITTVLACAFLVVSLLHTETSAKICSTVKETIAEQMQTEDILAWKDRVATYINQKELPVPVFEPSDPFEETEEKQEQDTTDNETDGLEERVVYMPDIDASP